MPQLGISIAGGLSPAEGGHAPVGVVVEGRGDGPGVVDHAADAAEVILDVEAVG